MPRHRQEAEQVRAPYFAEEVRRELLARYGEKVLYGAGLSVRTSLDERLQAAADKALRDALIAYDHVHGGWRGAGRPYRPRRRLAGASGGRAGAGRGERCRLAARGRVAHRARRCRDRLAGGETGLIPFSEMRWARPRRADASLGPAPRNAGDVVKPGDVVMVASTAGAASKADAGKSQSAGLHALPSAGNLGRARRDGSAHRPGAGAQRRLQFRDQPVRPRHPGQAADRLGDQAVRLSDRARPWFHAVDTGARRPDLIAARAGPADVVAGQLLRRANSADRRRCASGSNSR